VRHSPIKQSVATCFSDAQDFLEPELSRCGKIDHHVSEQLEPAQIRQGDGDRILCFRPAG
jgi:hypothetical protein